jgi:very-short-patch-repair endonuclease
MKNDFPRMEVSESIRRKMEEVARQFCKEATESEKILWQALRGKKLDGLKFRRQQPIGLFVVDFYEMDSVSASSPSPNLGEGKGGGN